MKISQIIKDMRFTCTEKGLKSEPALECLEYFNALWDTDAHSTGQERGNLGSTGQYGAVRGTKEKYRTVLQRKPEQGFNQRPQ